jgi:Secretion system C-terminal sorting domain
MCNLLNFVLMRFAFFYSIFTYLFYSKPNFIFQIMASVTFKKITTVVCAMSIALSSFAQAWQDVGFPISGSINATTNYGGIIYVGGNFVRANGAAASYVATYNGSTMAIPSGSTLTGTGINGFFAGTAASGLAGFFALGNYGVGGSTTVANNTKWSGAAWTDASYFLPGTCNAMASVIAADQMTIVTMAGGAFNNGTLKYIAKRNGTTWVAAGDGFDGPVNAIKATGTDIYAAGDFTKSGTTNLNRVAKWNAVTNKWEALGSGTTATLGFNGKVRCLEVFNGVLYAGGDFTTASGVACNLLAKWNATTNKWEPVGTSAFTGTSVRAMAVGSSSLLIGGDFTRVGTVVTKNAALLKITGTAPTFTYTFTAQGAGITSPINTIIYFVNKWYCGQEVALNATNALKVWNPTAPVATENIGTTIENINFTTAPNPANYECAISSETTIESLALYNITGSLVLSQNNIRSQSHTIATQDLVDGIYIVKIKTTEGKIGTKKLMVQH